MQVSLPWETKRTFSLWRYGIGHSQLQLRSLADDEAGVAINVLFEAVEFVKLHRSYSQAVFGLATEEHDVEFGSLPPIQLLRITISSPTDVGLVACSRMTVREAPSRDDDSPYDGKVLFHMIAAWDPGSTDPPS
jgi:hypothetical protein